jgi:hypothetical protein
MNMIASPGSTEEPIVLFTLTNHSGHDVKITHVGLEPLRPGGRNIFIPHPLPNPIAGPFPIGARDSVTVDIKPHVIADSDHDPNWPRVGTVIGRLSGPRSITGPFT